MPGTDAFTMPGFCDFSSSSFNDSANACSIIIIDRNDNKDYNPIFVYIIQMFILQGLKVNLEQEAVVLNNSCAASCRTLYIDFYFNIFKSICFVYSEHSVTNACTSELDTVKRQK